jgi:hypothetical protein
MKTVLILALIVAVCVCSEINPTKENPEGNEEKEETKGVVRKYSAASAFLVKLRLFRAVVGINTDTMSENPTGGSSDLLDTREDLEVIMRTAERLVELGIPEEDVGELKKATKLIDEMIGNMEGGGVKTSFVFFETIRELRKVRQILEQLKETSGAKSKGEGAECAECKTQVPDKEPSATVEEDDKLDSIAPEESSRL